MFGQGSLQASDAIELSGLCDSERSRALARFEIIRPFFEGGGCLSSLYLETWPSRILPARRYEIHPDDLLARRQVGRSVPPMGLPINPY
jgi:hypothetical protein